MEKTHEKTLEDTLSFDALASKGDRSRENPPSYVDRIADQLKYFPLFRMASYQFEALYDYIFKTMGRTSFIKNASTWFRDKVHDTIGFTVGSKMSNGELETYNILEDNTKRKWAQILPFIRDVEGVRPRGADGKIKAYLGQALPAHLRSLETRSNLFARNLLNVIEAVVFACITTLNFYFDRKKLKTDFAGAVAQEQHKKIDDVTMEDIKHSKNPIIQKQINNNGWKYAMRYFTDMAFAWGLKTGIVLKMSTYPLEYSFFQREGEFDELHKAVKDVQQNRLGDMGESTLIAAQIRFVQMMRTNLKQAPYSNAQIDRLNEEVFKPLAHMIIAEKAGIAECVTIGGMLLDPKLGYDAARAKLQDMQQATSLKSDKHQEDNSNKNPARRQVAQDMSRGIKAKQESFKDRLSDMQTADLVALSR